VGAVPGGRSGRDEVARPQVGIVRFYTNADGRAARRTTVAVLGLLGCFYVFPAVHGALGRLYAPQLLVTSSTEAVVLRLPRLVLGSGLASSLLIALIVAGAMAAFLSTASGLLIAVAGAISQDVLSGSVADFRKAGVGAGVVAVALGLQVADIDISVLVSWAFAVAASSLCPLIVLGIWWRGLTRIGAAAGMLAGGSLASIAVAATMLHYRPGGWIETVLAQPTMLTAPVAFTTMLVVSRRTAYAIPSNVARTMSHLHLPESLGLTRNWRE
jgi:cation/acetate symporter